MEMDFGNDCTLSMYVTTLNCTLKNGSEGKFYIMLTLVQ